MNHSAQDVLSLPARGKQDATKKFINIITDFSGFQASGEIFFRLSCKNVRVNSPLFFLFEKEKKAVLFGTAFRKRCSMQRDDYFFSTTNFWAFFGTKP